MQAIHRYKGRRMAKKILVVEDHADLRRLIRMVLDLEGHDVHEAGDGPAGLAAARCLQPDLVLLDVMMPSHEDGLEICRQLHGDPLLHTTPVVLLTAFDCAEDRDSSREAGAAACLRKPFSPRQLVDIVERQCPSSAGERFAG